MISFRKLGRPLPSLLKRPTTKARKDPWTGHIDRSLRAMPSKQQRLESFALQSKDAVGTLPERIVWQWLEHRKYQFLTQYIVSGGGARLDFLVILGNPPGVAVRVMGNFWHKMPKRIRSDAAQMLRLIAKGYRVVDLWELDIYAAVLAGNLYSWADKKLFEIA